MYVLFGDDPIKNMHKYLIYKVGKYKTFKLPITYLNLWIK